MRLDCFESLVRKNALLFSKRMVWKNGGPEPSTTIEAKKTVTEPGNKDAETDWFPEGLIHDSEVFDEIYRERLIKLIHSNRGRIISQLKGILRSKPETASMTRGELEALIMDKYGQKKATEMLKNEKKRAYEEVSLPRARYERYSEAKKARYDSLTGVGNRRNFNESLVRVSARAEREGTKTCLLMFDIDDFKRINDSEGYKAGDRILQEFVRIIKNELRGEEEIMRFGGEEFVVIMENTDLEGAEKAAERFREAVENGLPEFIKSDRSDINPSILKDFKGTVSVGVTTLPPENARNEENLAAFVERGGEAVHRAKEKGRNCVVALDSNVQVEERRGEIDVNREAGKTRKGLPGDSKTKIAILRAALAAEIKEAKDELGHEDEEDIPETKRETSSAIREAMEEGAEQIDQAAVGEVLDRIIGNPEEMRAFVKEHPGTQMDLLRWAKRNNDGPQVSEVA